jgi:nicotinamide-nucleotide amidase
MFNNEAIEIIREYFISNKIKLAVAESVTAGFLQAAFASAEFASTFFQGGITAYNIDQKVRHLGIDREAGEACNCVSAETANDMAKGVCSLFHSHWGVSITGYATPVEESGFRLYAFYSIARKGEIIDSGKISHEKEAPEKVQIHYVNTILDRLESALKKL